EGAQRFLPRSERGRGSRRRRFDPEGERRAAHRADVRGGRPVLFVQPVQCLQAFLRIGHSPESPEIIRQTVFLAARFPRRSYGREISTLGFAERKRPRLAASCSMPSRTRRESFANGRTVMASVGPRRTRDQVPTTIPSRSSTGKTQPCAR